MLLQNVPKDQGEHPTQPLKPTTTNITEQTIIHKINHHDTSEADKGNQIKSATLFEAVGLFNLVVLT